MTVSPNPPPGGDHDPGPLVGPSSLRRRLASAAPPVVLDVRWTLAGPDPDAYAAGHIPGAVFVDLDRDLTGPPGLGGRHPLPAPRVVAEVVRRAGITDRSTVVVCGQRDTSVAARAWWLLRWAGLTEVQVLDGGFEAWQRAGGAVATGPAPGGGTELTGGGTDLTSDGAGLPSDGPAPLRPGAMPVVDADGAARLGSDTSGVLVDVRAAERYRGEVEPVDPVAGHIPGAVNLPLARLHEADGMLRGAAELRGLLADVGVHDGAPAAASCGSGVNACSLVLAAEIVGQRVALYPGSYSGWCALGRAVQTGGR